MITVTFRSARKEPYYAMRAVERELIQCNAGRGFLVAEPFQSGDLHVHGLISGMGGYNTQLLPASEIWERMFKHFGRSRIEPANSQGAVSMYCSKYILKQQSRVCDYYTVFGSASDWKLGKISS
jgi:hypothetical protein